MAALRPMLAFLGVQPTEYRPVLLLMGLYFFLGAAIVFCQTVAFAMFLSANGPQMLPWVYLITAIGAALAAMLYLRLGDRLPFPTLLSANLAALALLSVLYRFGLTSTGLVASIAVFALPLWFQIVTNLGNLAYWALAGSMFTVRQGKRLFGLISTGNWVATIIGGFVAAPLIGLMGMPNLLLVSALCLFGAYVVLRVILRTCLPPRPAPSKISAAQAPPRTIISLLRSRYIVLIFAFLFIWWLGFNIVQSIFSDYAAQRFPDGNQLGAFLGDVAGVSGLLALLMNVFFTAPVVRRYGLWGGLLIMPVLVTLVIALLAVGGTWGAPVTALFALATLAKLINVGLGFGLDQPAHSILYKPLPGHQIGRVPIVAEGIVQPLAVGSAGVVLLIFAVLPNQAGASATGMAYLFVGIGLLWVIVGAHLIRTYRIALSNALAKRQLGDSPRAMLDQSSVAVLNRYLADAYPGAVVYALNSLEQLGARLSSAQLTALLAHRAVDVRREVFAYLERNAMPDMVNGIKTQLAQERVASVREAGMRALAASTRNVIADLSPALSQANLSDQRGALVGLMRHGGIDGILLAGQTFNRLLTSQQPNERVLAAQVLGEVGVTHFHQPIANLLQDESIDVRCAALHAAGKVKAAELWPMLVQACVVPETQRAAISALACGGGEALPWMEQALDSDDLPWLGRCALVQACGRIRGQSAVQLLERQLAQPQGELRSLVFAALSQCAYQPENSAARQQIQTQMQTELGYAAQIAAMRMSLQAEWGHQKNGPALLLAALDAELRHIRNRVLHLLSFLHEAGPLLKARQALMAMDYGPADPAQMAYAIELIDTQLSLDEKLAVLPVIELLTPEQRLSRFGSAVSQSALQCLSAMIAAPTSKAIAHWTQACALYVAGQQPFTELSAVVASRCNDPILLVRKMAQWVATRLQGDANASEVNVSMLSNVEKVIILKTVGVFAQTPDSVLSEVADLLEELVLDAGQVVFYKGDPGDSLYLIVYGNVQVRDGEQVLRHMGAREVFGEMALLDNEPRSATIVTVGPTQLLRLDQATFFDLLSGRPEIATGIIRVLMGYIRNLNQRLAEARDAGKTA